MAQITTLERVGYKSDPCRRINQHQHCEIYDLCACVCHTLDNDRIGWLRDELHEIIVAAGLATELRSEEWICAATVLATFTCGTDEVRIQHALGKGPRIIERAAQRLRDAGIWGDNTWWAPWAEEDSTDAELLELTLHALVAEGKALARREGDEFKYQAVPM